VVWGAGKNYGQMGPTPAQTRVDNCVGSFVSYCDDSDVTTVFTKVGTKRAESALQGYGPAGYVGSSGYIAHRQPLVLTDMIRQARALRAKECSDSHLSACFG
jgi:hypothetical protein